MKQSTLNFTASKRTASTNNAKANSKGSLSVPNIPVLSGSRTAPSSKKEQNKVETATDVSDEDEDNDEISDESSSEDDQEEIESDSHIVDEPAEKIENSLTPTVGRVTRSSSNKATPKAESKKVVKSSDEDSADTIKGTVFRPSNATPENVAKKVAANKAKESNDESLPKLNVKDRKYNKHYAEVKQRMNWHNPSTLLPFVILILETILHFLFIESTEKIRIKSMKFCVFSTSECRMHYYTGPF